jgi:carboxypeptidase C (cathepsin A)
MRQHPYALTYTQTQTQLNDTTTLTNTDTDTNTNTNPQIYEAGHMVPMDQPEAALAMLKQFTFQKYF